MEMSRYIVDISSTFQVSGLPDTISSNESRIKEISENISLYRLYIGYISVIYRYIGYKTARGANGPVGVDFCNFTDILVDIGDISAKKSARSDGQNCWTRGRLLFHLKNSKSPMATC